MIISWCLKKCNLLFRKGKKRLGTAGYKLTKITIIIRSIYKHEVKKPFLSRAEIKNRKCENEKEV